MRRPLGTGPPTYSQTPVPSGVISSPRKKSAPCAAPHYTTTPVVVST